MASLAVVIVSYNTQERLRACLRSVAGQDVCQVVVVDNASSDGSVDVVRREFPGVLLVANERNVGYGAAANQALSATSAEFVLLLNSDAVLASGAGRALVSYLEQQPRAAVVGPRLLNPDGSLQPSCYPFPTPLQVFLQESTLERALGRVPWLRARYLRTWGHACAAVVPWVLGAALCIRRSAFDAVGGFDSAYFMYFEEADLCYRLRRLGWEVHFTPTADVIHVGGASTARHPVEMRRRWHASLIRFYRRHYAATRLAQVVLVMDLILIARLARDTLRVRHARDGTERACAAAGAAAWRRTLALHWRGQLAPS